MSPLQVDAHGTGEGSDEFKYGVQRFLDLDILADGTWETQADGGRVCRYSITSPGAVMISVQFDRFNMDRNASLYVYNTDRTYFIGAFTEANEQATGDLATQVVPGDAIVIEYIEPLGAFSARSDLHVSSITHGYRDIFKFGERGLFRDINPGYQSAPCHNNTICPVAAAWQNEKRAVALFLRPDGGGCTGSLLNNTQQNGIPYFYIANHCYVNNESQWVFYFNYESPQCAGDTGITTHTLTGAVPKGGDYYTDYVLLQLNAVPPPNYQPYYLGWDHSGAVPQSATVIEHPLFDVKKIAFDYNPSTSYATLPYAGSPDSTRLWKCYWDSGIIESVASGAPMLDQNHRMVGHMNEGAQNCSNAATVHTGCAKFSRAWDAGTNGARLRDWLAPGNSAVTLNGYDPYASGGVKVKLRVILEGGYNTTTQLMNGTLRTLGLVPLTEPYSALGYVHVNGGGGESTPASVMNITGSASVVDWVVIELRNKLNSSQVVATKSALLLRNGNVVSNVDGTSDVSFANMPADDYFIAVRHRNHLGICTQAAQTLTSTATLKDLSTGTIALVGNTAATDLVGTKRCMVSGDAVRDNILRYTGSNNDRDVILVRLGGTNPATTITGYYQEDTNLDGVVKYTGTSNDRDIILVNVGGSVPNATRTGQLP